MLKKDYVKRIMNHHLFDGFGYYNASTKFPLIKGFMYCSKNYYKYSELDTIKMLMKKNKLELIGIYKDLLNGREW